MPPWNGVIGEDGVEIQRVYSVDAATGTGHFLTPANLHVYEFDWAPNSHDIAFIAANPPGENNWWIAKLYAEPISGPEAEVAPHVVLDPNTIPGSLHGLQIAVPRYSPDGKHIAFIGGLMSDQGSTGGDICVIDTKGGDPTDITPNIDGTPTFKPGPATTTSASSKTAAATCSSPTTSSPPAPRTPSTTSAKSPSPAAPSRTPSPSPPPARSPW